MRLHVIAKLLTACMTAALLLVFFQNLAPNEYYLNPLVFNHEDYKKFNPDLANLTNTQLESHWINYGMANGRQASANFSVMDYRSMYVDIQNLYPTTNYIGAIEHYLDTGYSVSRAGTVVTSPSMFSKGIYERAIGRESNPFETLNEARKHYATYGVSDSIQASTTFIPEAYLTVYPHLRTQFGNNYYAAAKHYYNSGRPLALRTGLLAKPTQDDWVNLMKSTRNSDVVGYNPYRDRAISFQTYDGLDARVVVKQPNILSGESACNVSIPASVMATDATAAFAAELQRIKALTQKCYSVNIPYGEYHFSPSTQDAHVKIDGFSDVIFVGNNSKFFFYQNKPGLMTYNSQRILIKDLELDWSEEFPLSTIGRIEASTSGNILRIEPGQPWIPATGNDIASIAQISGDSGKSWLRGGEEIYFSTKPTALGNATFTSSEFQNLPVGSRYVIRRFVWGSAAVLIYGDKNKLGEDISLYNLTIYAAPGMGVVVNGHKRGFLLADSRIVKKEPRAISTTADGVHLINIGGDIIIERNDISSQGDDAINVTSLIKKVKAIDQGNLRRIEVESPGLIFRVGDNLGFFNEGFGHLGNATVSAVTIVNPTETVSGTAIIELNDTVPHLKVGDRVRNIEFSSSRYVISENQLHDHRARGILAQAPNGLISANTFFRNTATAIILYSDANAWGVGTGAINVNVVNNIIDGTATGRPAAIMATSAVVGEASGTSKVAEVVVHSDLIFTGNSIANPNAACFFEASTRGAKIENNNCTPATGFAFESNQYSIGISRSGNTVGP